MSVPLPSYVQIEPVGQCNLRCQMCAIQFRHDGPPHGPLAFISVDDFKRIIDQYPTLTELHLQGLGEPLMHPRFFDMVSYASARGIRVSANTNMTLLNLRRAERCVTSGLEQLHVSIDAARPETYERIRVRARFDRVVRNVEMLLDARHRLGSRLPRMRIVTVIMRQNLADLPDLVRLASTWSADGLFVQHLCHDFAESTLPQEYRPMRRFVEDQTLLTEEPDRVAYYFEEARRVAAQLGVDLRLPRTSVRAHAPGTPGRQRCSWPWTGAYISYQGFAMPCCMVSTPDRANFGNVVTDGVSAVWSGDEYEDFRRRLASDNPPEICRTCSIYTGTF